MSFTAKSILGAIAFKCDGNWNEEFRILKEKIALSDEEVKNFSEKISTDYLYLTSGEYPRNFLNCLKCPPIVLFYKGDISLLTNTVGRKYIAIVGSRNASDYGRRSVGEIVKSLPDESIIVSGLAKGIDRAAHEAALDNGLKTIAVLGNGIDYVYPSENKDLYERIVENGGLLLSEYPNLTKPKPDQFVFRNRIVAAISDFLLIGEAYDRSGSSTTVNYALNCGKPVGCIPFPRDSKSLCNKLIKDGALLVESASDIVYEIGRKDWWEYIK